MVVQRKETCTIQSVVKLTQRSVIMPSHGTAAFSRIREIQKPLNGTTHNSASFDGRSK
jgi:hypothetical protein